MIAKKILLTRTAIPIITAQRLPRQLVVVVWKKDESFRMLPIDDNKRSYKRPSLSTTMTLRPNIRVLRDMKARQGVLENEVTRRAYLYVARNQSLPPQIRHQAQLQLNTFGRYTRPTTVKNRCYETGRGRGIMSEFGLCRVSDNILLGYKSTDFIIITVPVSFEGIGWAAERGQEGILVV